MRLDIALVEWPDSGVGGPRLVGRLDDPDLVAAARDRLAAAHRRELASLAGPVRLVAPAELEDAPA